MASDDAADLLGDLSTPPADRVIDMMDSEDTDPVQALLAHEEDTAGGLMDICMAVVHQSVRGARAIDVLKEEASDLEVFEFFVVIDEKYLVGELPVSRLVKTSPSTPIDLVKDTDVIHEVVTEDIYKIAGARDEEAGRLTSLSCVGAAMFLVTGFAVLLGVTTSLVFRRLGLDPAIASGPFITIMNDVIGLFIFLGLATFLLQHFLYSDDALH